MAHLHLRKSKKILMLVLALIVVISSMIASVAVFTDRVNRTTTIQVSTFGDDGYAIKRTAPDGYFTAGETVEVTLQESNTKSEDITSQITMTVLWTSPVPNVYPWGNTSTGNAVITFDGETVPYTVNSDKTITFTLPEKVLAASTSDIASSLKFQIPSDLASTGKLSFNFDRIELGYASWTTSYNNIDLESLDFNVSVAWNISKKQTTAAGNPNRDVIAVLTQSASSGQYGLEVIKNGSDDNTNNGQMMDWSAKDQTPWAAYTITDLSMDEGVTSVGDYAFAGETGITSLNFPSTMTDIGTSAFDGIGLSGELVIPASIEKIESLAFGNLPNVNTITFEHTSDDNLSLPNNTTAGKETSGAFYVPNYVKTTFDFNGNSDAEKYNWVNDNRMKVGITSAELTYDDVVVGQTVDPGLVILPDDHDDYQSIHYEVIEGDEHATVDPDTGVVTGVAQGSAIIQVTIVDANGDEITAQGTVNILGIGITDATLAYDDVVIGQTVDPDLDILPENHGPVQSTLYEITEGEAFAEVVDSTTGVVKGLAQGTATVKVTVTDTNGNEVSTTATVNVLGIGVSDVELTYDDVVIGQTVNPDLDILPENHGPVQSTLYEIIEGETFAEVVDSTTGVVKGLAQGTATVRVTVTDTNGNEASTTAAVNVLGIGISDVDLTYDDVVVGQTVTPDLNLLPANHGPVQSTLYEITEGGSFAEVLDPATGVVKGLAQGSATVKVTVTDTNGNKVSTTATVNVLGIGITDATLAYDDVRVGETVTPDLGILPANHGPVQSVTYTITAGETFAEVINSTSGVVKGLSVGTATIQVTIVDTNGVTVTALGTVNVYNPVPTLAEQQTWYTQGGTSVDKTAITSIDIVDIYNTSGKTIVSTWDASAGMNGTVTAYVESDGSGSTYKLTLAGNGYGKIYANADSSDAFHGFTALTAVNGADILDTSNTTTMRSMFNRCNLLTTLDTGNWNTSKVGDMAYMFVYCDALTTVDVATKEVTANGTTYTAWDTSNVEDMDSMFCYCYKLNSLDVSGWDTGKVGLMQYMFNFCKKLPSLDVSNWDVSNVTDTSAMFQFCSVLETLDVSKWTFSTKLKDTSSMFSNCAALQELKVENWIMDSVTDANTMFSGCETLTTLAVDNWNVGNVIDMDFMFHECTSMTSLNVSKWNVSSATGMEMMFAYCESLPTLAIDNWNVSNVKDMRAMFIDCSSLTTLNVSNWETTSLSLVTHYSGEYHSDDSTRYYWDQGMFEGCSSLSVIDISGWDMDQITNDARMFYGCTSLKSLTIPASLSIISPEFAYNCTKLTEINFLHDSDDPLSMPTAGAKTADMYPSADANGVYSDGGAFYVPSYLQTTFDFNGNATAEGYDWATDNRLLNIPTLAASNTWFAPNDSAITKYTISSVTLMNSYTPTGTLVDSWPAAVDADGDGTLDSDIMAYAEDDGLNAGTYKLTIAGNGNPHGIFYANEDSSRAFWLFSAMTSFNNSSVMDTSKVKYMGDSHYSNYGMFQGCKSLTSLDLSSWDTSKVQSTISLFYACTNLKDLNISGWDMSSCKRMVYMFSDCLALETVDIGNWNTSNVIDMSAMFEDSTAINYLDVATKEVTVDGVTYTAWDVGKVEDMGSMFRNCESLPTLDVSNWDVGKVEDMLNLFSGCSIINNLNVSNWDTSSVETMQSMFGGCESLTSIDVSKWNLASAKFLGGMFGSCSSLPAVDVATKEVTVNGITYTAWDTSTVEDMGGMFSGCDIINGMDMTGWDTSSVKDMSSMFSMCYALVDPTVQNFDTSAVTDMEAMFYQCHSIQTLDLSNWVTSNVTAMAQDGTHNGMFYDCRNLTTIYATHRFDVTNVTESDYMFGECLKLVGGAGTAYRSANDDKAYAHVDGGTANPGYFTNHIFLSYNDVPVGETVNAQLTIKSTVFDDYASIAYEVISGNDYATVNATSGKVTGVAKGTATIQVTLDAANGDTITAQAAVNVTGPIPILASGGSWFNPTNANVTRPKITSITFADTYTPSSTPADSWDASDKKNNSVTAYAEDDGSNNGTYKLTIAGNGYGCIFANAMSAYAFGGIQDEDQFSAMTSFNDPNKIFNTSMATTMSRMFEEAVALKTIDAGHWDTSNVDSMHMLFFYCESLESVDVSNWDMRNVETLHWAFDNCESLTTLDTSDWTFTKLTDLYGTFYGCRKLATLDVSSWDVSKVTTLQDTFSSCRSLKVIDVSKWNTQNVECMDYTFQYCVSLETVPVGNWNTGKCTSMDYMFAYCEALASLDVATKAVAAGTLGTGSAAYTAWDVSQVKTLTATFIDCENITFLDVSDWTTTALVNTISTFDGCVKLATLDVSGWNMSSVKQAYLMFTDCESLAVIDVSHWNTSSMKQISDYVYSAGRADLGMFENCTSLKSIDLSSWNMSQITNTAHMFYNCASLESIIIPASAAYISAEFAYNCPNLTSITFLHGANDALYLPDAGEKTSDLYPSDSADEYGVYSDGGAFYVSSNLNTTVNSNGNASVTDYNWDGDNRTVTSTASMSFMSMLNRSDEADASGEEQTPDVADNEDDSNVIDSETDSSSNGKNDADGSDTNQDVGSEDGKNTVIPEEETDPDDTDGPDSPEGFEPEDPDAADSDENQDAGSEEDDNTAIPDEETDPDGIDEPDTSDEKTGSEGTDEPDDSEGSAAEDSNPDESDANQDSNSDASTETKGSESSSNQDPSGEVTTTPELSIPDETGTIPEETETEPVTTPDTETQESDS